nr:MAG: major capsid protein [Microvirus Sku121]
MANIRDLNRFVTTQSRLNKGRSRFPINFNVKHTFKSGYLTPLKVLEVLPGDTWDIDISSLIRSITPAAPVMDNLFADIFSFFVPNRLMCKHPDDWAKICGENVDGAWAQTKEYTLGNTGNTSDFDGYDVKPGSLGCSIGMPIFTVPDGQGNEDFYTTMYLRGYYKIVNEYFRDQNIEAPLDFENLIDTGKWMENDSCYRACKFHDYFTSALPSPQKSINPVQIPLLGLAPVITGKDEFSTQGMSPMKLKDSNNQPYLNGSLGVVDGSVKAGEGFVPLDTQVNFSNLYADLSKVSGTTINQLRLAFALQELFEKDALYGTRYEEVLYSHFGVSPKMGVLQKPQYLGGAKINLRTSQVVSTSELTDGPLGSVGGLSVNSSTNKIVNNVAFEEFGAIFVMIVVRPMQTYSQGLPVMFSRNRRFDFYWPIFANLPEQAIKKQELYFGLDHFKNIETFGFKEAWCEYKSIPDSLLGYFSAGANDTFLSAYTYGLKLSGYPALGTAFIKSDPRQVDDTLIVKDSPYQFYADFYFSCKAYRVMPVYSVPGNLGRF